MGEKINKALKGHIEALALLLALGTQLYCQVRLVEAVYKGRESLIISGLVDTFSISVFSTLGLLVMGKSFTALIPARFRPAGHHEAPPPAPPAGDKVT